MKFNKRLYTAVIAVLSLPFSAESISDGPAYRLSLGLQVKELTYEQEYSSGGSTINEAKFTAEMPVLTAAFTGVYDRFFATLKYEQSAEKNIDTDETDRSINDGINPNLISVAGSDTAVERKDISFTVGYNVWESLNVFIGVLSGETSLRPHPLCANPTAVSGATACTRLNRSFQQFLAGDFDTNLKQADYIQRYKESGFFIGSSYGWAIGDVGGLALSVAYADMDGSYKDNANDPNNIWQGTLERFHYEGDASGTSIGLTWTASLGERAEYYVDLRRQSYSMDADDQTGSVNLSTISLHTDETILGISAGVQYYF